MPAESPSEILATLKSGHTPAEYLKILEKHVYPALDRLPAKEKTALVKALSKTSDDHKDAELVNFDGMQMSLSKQQKALAKSVRSDWKTGWQEQVRARSMFWSALTDATFTLHGSTGRNDVPDRWRHIRMASDIMEGRSGARQGAQTRSQEPQAMQIDL